MAQIQLTKEEIANGWTEDTLKQYLMERDAALNAPKPVSLPVRQIKKSPFRR